MDEVRDPDRWALAIVQQFLAEHGFNRALEALEQEAGLRVQHEVQHGSQLLQLVYDRMEQQLAASCQDDATIRLRRLEEELLASGSASFPTTCPSRLQRSIDGLHTSNIICIQCWPHRCQAVTGSSDGSVAVLGYDGALHRRMQAGNSGVLCLALQADNGSGSGSAQSGGGSSSSLVAAGCMDGSMVVLDAASGALLARAQPHRKYVVAAAWVPGGAHLVTAAWDQSFAVHHLQRRAADGKAAAAAGDGSGGRGSSCGGGEWELVTIHTEQTAAKVNAVQFLPGTGSGTSSSSNDSSFLVAVQGSNYLRQLCIRPSSGGGPAAVREERWVNMNAYGDDHVSFSAAQLALSPCGRLLLVLADNGRLMVYEREGWLLVRSLIGLPMEQFHQFCAAFDRSGSYIMAAAAHGGLCIFHVGSSKRVALLPAHSKNVRGLCYDAEANLLLTCSFDRSVKVWEAAQD